MEEPKELSEKLSEDELAYKALAARIEMIKLQNKEPEKPGILSEKDYVQVVIIIAVCLCALIAGAFWAA